VPIEAGSIAPLNCPAALVAAERAGVLFRDTRPIIGRAKPTDLVTFVTVIVLLSAIALIVRWIPARRATRVSPLAALRYE